MRSDFIEVDVGTALLILVRIKVFRGVWCAARQTDFHFARFSVHHLLKVTFEKCADWSVTDIVFELHVYGFFLHDGILQQPFIFDCGCFVSPQP